MDNDQFTKYHYRAFEEIEYHSKNGIISCMLVSVDFEERLFKLEPLDKGLYESDPFWVRCESCKKPLRKLKIKIKQHK